MTSRYFFDTLRPTDNNIFVDNENNGYIGFNGVKTNVIFNKKIKKGDFVYDPISRNIGVSIEDENYSIVSFVMFGNNTDKPVSDCTNIVGCQTLLLESNENLIELYFETRFCDFAYDCINQISKYRTYLKSPICPICGEEVGWDSASIDGKKVCRRCFNKNYRYCENCNAIYAINPENPDETLCPDCAKRDYILPYHHYNPPLDFCGYTMNNKVPYLGVEIEVDEGGQKDKMAKAAMKYMNKDRMFVYCMRDGSLNEGFEIITQPATLKYHQSQKDNYEAMFNFLISKGYLSHDTQTCGIHVHFNRDFYKDNEELYVTRLLYLVDKFWDDIVRFSRRNQRRIDRYSKKVDMPLKEYFIKSNKSNIHDYHYYAINLSNSNTIEFRMFKGTLNIDTFMATLQFVNNCIICAREKSAEEIQRMEFEELITGRVCKNYWKTRKGRKNTEE